MSVIYPPVAGLTSTPGTGSFTISAPLPVPGTSPVIDYRAWSTVPNGSRLHVVRSDTGLNIYERGYVDVTNSGGVVTLAFNPRLETSAGGSDPISWAGGGTQNVWVVPFPFDPANGGSELAAYAQAFRASLGMPTTSDPGGVTPGAVVQLISGNAIPAGVVLPTHYHSALLNSLYTGGSNSRILRKPAGSTVLTNAALSDSPAALQFLLARGSDGLLYYPGSEVPFTGAAADTRYYLGTAGALSTTFSNGLNDTPDGTHTQVVLGYGIASGMLWFKPERPVGGLLSSGGALRLEGGDLKV
jgi:hypothetical protein